MDCIYTGNFLYTDDRIKGIYLSIYLPVEYCPSEKKHRYVKDCSNQFLLSHRCAIKIIHVYHESSSSISQRNPRQPTFLTPKPFHPNGSRLEGRTHHRKLLMMIHGLHTRTRLWHLIRFPPRRFTAAVSALHILACVSRPTDFLGPRRLLHGAVTAAEFGAEVGREEGDEEGDSPEEGLQYGQAAADDCEVDFYDPVKR